MKYFKPGSTIVALSLIFVGCDGGRGEENNCEPDEQRIEITCPEDIDLGCIPADGSALEYEVESSSCEGEATIDCSHPSGEMVTPSSEETVVTCTARSPQGSELSCDFNVIALPEGSFGLECRENQSFACTSALTQAEIDEPDINEICGTPVGALMSDQPNEGLPIGETTVTFSASGDQGFSTQCSTLVTIVDEDPPVFDCPSTANVARSSPTDEVSPPSITSIDQCEGDFDGIPSPETLAGGTQTVTYTSTDSSGNEGQCQVDVTVIDLFAVTGLQIISATLNEDESTSVTLGWDLPDFDETIGLRVERSENQDGPWEALGEVSSDTVIFTDPTLPASVVYYRVVTFLDDVDGGSTEPLRALSIVGQTYDIRNQPVNTVPFLTTLYGVARFPEALSEGPFPLVLFLHGNHGNCRPDPFVSDDVCSQNEDHVCPWSGYTTTPNAEGLAYLGETLAAQGYITASLSGNAVNCREDYIIERSELIIEHLRRWEHWSRDDSGPFGDLFISALDLENVGLVGHSRGGEAVAHVPERLSLSPIDGLELASIFSIAPTDYHEPHPEGVPYAVLLPGCDGDVSTMAGMHIYDRSIVEIEFAERVQVFFPRANHNFFSTEWHYDDNRWGIVCPRSAEAGVTAQQGMLDATLSAWFRGTINAEHLEGFLTTERDIPEPIHVWSESDLDLRISYSGAERILIDDFTGAEAPLTNLLNQPNSFESFTAARSCYEEGCDGSFPHRKQAIVLSWDGGSPRGGWNLGGLDASEHEALTFRMTSRWSRLNNGIVAQEFLIRMVDSDGTEVEMDLSEVQIVPHLYETHLIREMLQTVRLDFDELIEMDSGFNTSSVERFEVEMVSTGRPSGSIILTDIELTD